MDADAPQARQFLSDVDRQGREVSKIPGGKAKALRISSDVLQERRDQYRTEQAGTGTRFKPQPLVQSADRRAVSGAIQPDSFGAGRLHNAYSEGRKALDDRNFSKALQICTNS